MRLLFFSCSIFVCFQKKQIRMVKLYGILRPGVVGTMETTVIFRHVFLEILGDELQQQGAGNEDAWAAAMCRDVLVIQPKDAKGELSYESQFSSDFGFFDILWSILIRCITKNRFWPISCV